MSKILKITILFTIIFSMYTYISNAETTNLYNDVENETTSNTSTETDSDNTVSDNTIDDDLEDDIDLLDDRYNSSNESNTSPSVANMNTARVNTVSSISEANLGLNNVLCIILIAIGILIILLAIAILIKLK